MRMMWLTLRMQRGSEEEERNYYRKWHKAKMKETNTSEPLCVPPPTTTTRLRANIPQ
jgi:hypothetical protein